MSQSLPDGWHPAGTIVSMDSVPPPPDHPPGTHWFWRGLFKLWPGGMYDTWVTRIVLLYVVVGLLFAVAIWPWPFFC